MTKFGLELFILLDNKRHGRKHEYVRQDLAYNKTRVEDKVESLDIKDMKP